jgi:DNA-binding transcriptional MerR regulator
VPVDARVRVEELARRLGLSVDTIRYYQKRGLLPAPEVRGRIAWYGPVHADRLRRIKQLQASGLTLAVIKRVLDGELDDADLPLAAVVARARAEPGEAGAARLTLGELAARSGVPSELIEAVVREGLLVPLVVDGGEYFTEEDVGVVQAGLALLGAGIPLPALLDLARRHDRATRQSAEAAVKLFDRYVRQPLKKGELEPEERARRLVEAFSKLLPVATTLVSHHFRRALLEIAQAHLESVGEPAEIAAAQREAKQLTELA